MPIKPENKHLYPDNWEEIREQILKRANNCCEGSPDFPDCRAPNYWYRNKRYHDDIQQLEELKKSTFWIDQIMLKAEWSRIVLTIAHLDHDPTNNNPENLRAWCQRCHLNYDKELHKHNSALTRRKKLPTKDMFL